MNLMKEILMQFVIRALIRLSFQTNYVFMKKCVQSNPVVPIQQQWLMSMLTLVPQSLVAGRELLIEKLLGEIIKDFEKSMKRCMGEYCKLHSTVISVCLRFNNFCMPAYV